MKSTVIVPCWKRPEFLGACLTLIQRADGWENYHYLFAADRGAVKENFVPIDSFPGEKTVVRQNHRFHGNSCNLIRAYHAAYDSGAPLIFLIEEDIFIAKDFFTYHEQVQAETDTFFVTACRNQMDHRQSGSNSSGLFRFHKYQSLGVSFKRQSLIPILQHDDWQYYSNRRGYLMKRFPGSVFGDHNTEQDGLINRIMERDSLTGIYPEIPRAFHAGFYGYNRPGRRIEKKDLPLQDKIRLLLEMPEIEMNSRANRLKDIARCDLSASRMVDKYFINDFSD